jgi:hypothetical protein
MQIEPAFFDRAILAARGLLDWPQGDLAEAATLGLATAKNFESERRETTVANVKAIQHALRVRNLLATTKDENGQPFIRKIAGNIGQARSRKLVSIHYRNLILVDRKRVSNKAKSFHTS